MICYLGYALGVLDTLQKNISVLGYCHERDFLFFLFLYFSDTAGGGRKSRYFKLNQISRKAAGTSQAAFFVSA